MKNILALLLVSLLFLGCTKPKEEEPPKSDIPLPSQNGANILVCKVNGELHIYRTESNWNSSNGVSYQYFKHSQNFSVSLGASDGGYHDYIKVEVFVKGMPIDTTRSYGLTSEDGSYAKYSTTWGTLSDYRTEENSGQIRFTRCDADVAAGTFSFTAYAKDGKKINISEGYFDIARTTL